MKTILVCNEIPEVTQSKAASVGLRLLVKPMIRVVVDELSLPSILQVAAKDTSEAWVFTSKNAVKVFDMLRQDLRYDEKKFFVIGQKTAELLIHAGITVIIPEQETAVALAQLITAEGVKSVLFWCGNLRREELPALLRAKGIVLHELIVYQTGLYPVRITEHYDAVVFLSSSAVESFFSVNELPTHTPVFAIGATAASALKSYVSENMIVPARPDVDLLLQMIHDYFYGSKK